MFCNKNYIKLLIIIALATFLWGCKHNNESENINPYDLESIQKKGKLVVITNYNSISYFIYRGAPMGYQYELLQDLCKFLDLELELMVSNNIEDSFNKLQNNECSLLAMNLTVTNERKQYFNFTLPIEQTRQVLIQKKPEGWERMSRYSINKHLIRNQLDLAKKNVYVLKNSSFYDRLQNLQSEIGDSIYIHELEDYSDEQLISLVSKGEIDYTVSDENVAKLNQAYFPNIDIATPISFPQNQAWAVNKNTPHLHKKINEWITKINTSNFYAIIYNKYFLSKNAKTRTESPYMYIQNGKISPYDRLFKKYSKTIGWDWRLLASLVYQESRFNPHVESWAGAYGLMQLIPVTAKRFGTYKGASPESNVKAGTKFIKWLDKQLIDSVPNKEERIKFILAAYNAGLGHIWDARRLAIANNKKGDVWDDNVSFFIINKSNHGHADKNLVRYGFLRGEETYNYVDKIIQRYKLYCNLAHK